MSFNVGDIVRLKSGGPKMTVVLEDRDATHANGKKFVEVTCRWAGQNVQDGCFPSRTLVLVSPVVLS